MGKIVQGLTQQILYNKKKKKTLIRENKSNLWVILFVELYLMFLFQ